MVALLLNLKSTANVCIPPEFEIVTATFGSVAQSNFSVLNKHLISNHSPQ